MLTRSLRNAFSSSGICSSLIMRTYSTASSSKMLKSLAPRCHCCGSAFHSVNPTVPGYKPVNVEENKPKISFKAEKNVAIDELFEKLPEEKKVVLAEDAISMGSPSYISDGVEWSTSKGLQIEKSQADHNAKQRELTRKHLCIRCRDIRGGKTPAIYQPYSTYADLVKNIPQSATIVNVIDALDFPITIDKSLLSSNRSGRVLWVVNRVDLMTRKQHHSTERALPYIRDTLAELIGANPDCVFAVSAKFGWSISTLYSALSTENYLIGYTNSGKTKLALQLASKFGLPLSKPEGLMMAATNTMPWSTQAPGVYELTAKKVVIDMPSIPEPTPNLYDALIPKEIRKVPQGHLLFKEPKMYNAKRVVASKRDQLISIGGLVAIQPENPAIGPQFHTIAWGIYFDSLKKTRVFKSLDKIRYIIQSEDKVHRGWSYARAEVADSIWNNSTTMTFKQEGLSLVIRGLGSVHLYVSGKIPEEGIKVTIYHVDGVEVQRRPNIISYLRDIPKEEREEENER